MLEKVTDPIKIVTDLAVLGVLEKQGIDKDYVEFWHDYAPSSLGDEYAPNAKFYRDLKSGKRIMKVGGPPRVIESGEKIKVGWFYDNGKYRSEVNTFSSVVENREIMVEARGKEVIWKPQLYLNSIETSPFLKAPTVLETDPTNPNYNQNVLEWDYGACQRRIRIIQGLLREWWGISYRGRLEVAHNLSGDLPVRIGYGRRADGEYLPIQVIGDREIIDTTNLPDSAFPVEIGASPETFTTTSADGDIGNLNANYFTAHDAAAGTSLFDTNDYVQGDNGYYPTWPYQVRRMFLPFATGSLPNICRILGVTSLLYGSYQTEPNAGHSDLCIYKGAQHAALELADYDAFVAGLLTAGTYSWAYPLATDDYNEATLIDVDSDDYGYINKLGNTLLCIRLKGDVDRTQPTGSNRVRVWSAEKGVGFYPLIVVTYELPSHIRPGFVNFQDPGIL